VIPLSHEGKHPYNAETTIDYIDKKVSFNYTQDINRENNWKAYADHSIFYLIGLWVGIRILTFFILVWGIITLFVLIFFSFILGSRAMGGISIILHENIPWMKKIYPKSNAIFQIIFKKLKRKFKIKKEIDFSKIPETDDLYLRNTHMVIGNNLIMNYSIALSEYELEGDCAKFIKRIRTICIEENEKKRKSPGVMKFRIVFEFNQRPINGKVVIF